MNIFPGCEGKGTNPDDVSDSKISDRRNRKRMEVLNAPELRRPDFYKLTLQNSGGRTFTNKIKKLDIIKPP